MFQNPAASLNPRMRVESILGYVIPARTGQGERRSASSLWPSLARSASRRADEFMQRYPHQLSGGQQQRVAIARAMMLKPRLIIADEPLSSLDISIQTQILDLMRELRLKTKVGFLLISHDLNAVRSIADRVVVMYRGRIVEAGRDVLAHPLHPYTRALLDARLIPDPKIARTRKRIVLESDAASAPPLSAAVVFRDRCPFVISVCETHDPALRKRVRRRKPGRLPSRRGPDGPRPLDQPTRPEALPRDVA